MLHMDHGLTVGRLAQAGGVKASAVRYYDQLGLLPRPMRTASGYRAFSQQAVGRLTLVRAAQQFGFSLRDIAAFFRVRDAGGKPCQHVHDAGQRMLNALEIEIAALHARRRQIRRTLQEWDHILARTPGDRRAHLLEALKMCPRRSPGLSLRRG
jgi:DNA-binding transcriptional MerR regulator